VIVVVPADGFITYNNKSAIVDSSATLPEVTDNSITKSVITTTPSFDFFTQFISITIIVLVTVGCRRRKK
jgi:hypothetical protein